MVSKDIWILLPLMDRFIIMRYNNAAKQQQAAAASSYINTQQVDK